MNPKYHLATPRRRLHLAIGLALVGACLRQADDTGDDDDQSYHNTTDPSNNGAGYVGAAACGSCHSDTAEQHALHGHAHMLTEINGEAPSYPAEAARAGVPAPPEGFEWTDIAYVIGGYTRKANFVDGDGYLLTNGGSGVDTQWNLAFEATGSEAGFVSYEPDAEAPKPYDYSCFSCHATGTRPPGDPPQFQDNRPGIAGTWRQAGVQCEACHGPGSNHVPNPSRRDLYVDLSASSCGQCHMRGEDPDVIDASGGYIEHYEQWPELRASGGHAEFGCAVCHDPHRSANYDAAAGIRTQCTTCHPGQNLAIHEDMTFIRGTYREPLSCASCHLPFATRSATRADGNVVGEGRMGDTRTHIFRINTLPVGAERFFTDDGSAVATDSQGRAAVTLDFVCFRCHNDKGNAPSLSLQRAADVASGMHAIQRP